MIFTPVLSEQDAQAKCKEYIKLLKDRGAEILEEDFWGLKQLAYPIQKKTTGMYFVTEYRTEGTVVDELEVLLKRDTSNLRFLTVRLDKYAIKYNDEKRRGLVGRNKKKVAKAEDSEETKSETQN